MSLFPARVISLTMRSMVPRVEGDLPISFGYMVKDREKGRGMQHMLESHLLFLVERTPADTRAFHSFHHSVSYRG